MAADAPLRPARKKKKLKPPFLCEYAGISSLDMLLHITPTLIIFLCSPVQVQIII